jgi:hypothetical protein
MNPDPACPDNAPAHDTPGLSNVTVRWLDGCLTTFYDLAQVDESATALTLSGDRSNRHIPLAAVRWWSQSQPLPPAADQPERPADAFWQVLEQAERIVAQRDLAGAAGAHRTQQPHDDTTTAELDALRRVAGALGVLGESWQCGSIIELGDLLVNAATRARGNDAYAAWRALHRVAETLGVAGEVAARWASAEQAGEYLAGEVQRRTQARDTVTWVNVADQPGPPHSHPCWVLAPGGPGKPVPVVQIGRYDGAWSPGLAERSSRKLTGVTWWADMTWPDYPVTSPTT